MSVTGKFCATFQWRCFYDNDYARDVVANQIKSLTATVLSAALLERSAYTKATNIIFKTIKQKTGGVSKKLRWNEPKTLIWANPHRNANNRRGLNFTIDCNNRLSIPVRDHDQSVLVQLRTSSDDQHIHSTVAGRSSIHRPRTRLRSRDYRPFPNWPSPLPDTSSSQPPQEPNALWKLFNGFCNRKLRVTFCRQAFAVSLETFYIKRSQRSSTILTFIPESVSRKHPASVCDLL